jgi:hypothetical protein
MSKNFSAIEVLGVDEDYPVDRINVCYVINEIMTPEEHDDFSVRRTFFEIPENKINELVIRTDSSNYNPYLFQFKS